MALETQPIDIPFAGGLSKKLDAVIPDRGRVLELSNGSFSKDLTLLRRAPWGLLPGATGIKPIEMATLGNELLAIDETTNGLYSYSSTSDALVNRGTPPYCQLAVDTISANTRYKQGLDHASTDGFSIYVWRDINKPGGTVAGISYSVIDDATGTILINAASLKTSSAVGLPRVCVGGPSMGHFLVVFATSATVIQMASVLASTGAIVTAATNVATDSATSGGTNFYDLSAFLTGAPSGLGLLAYSSSKAGAVVGALLFSYLGTVTNAEITAVATGVLTTNITTIALAPFSASANVALMVGDSGSNNLYTAIINYAGTTLSMGAAAAALAVGWRVAQVTAVVDPATNSLKGFVHSDVPSLSANSLRTFTLTSANSAALVAEFFASTGGGVAIIGFDFGDIATKAFASASTVYVVIALRSTLQNSLYVIDASANVVAVLLYGESLPNPVGSLEAIAPEGKLPSVVRLSPTSFSVPALRQGNLTFSGGEAISQAVVTRGRLTIGRASKDGAGTGPLWHAQAAGSVYFSGSYMAMYDGAQVSEAGFFYFPEGVDTGASGAGAVSGTFQMCALYEWVDNNGRRHQSAPSPPETQVLTNNTTLEMAAPPLYIGTRVAGATVVFYRTVNGGTTFYRVNAADAPLGNTTTTGSIAYSDTTVTSSATADPITSNEILYTTGGALPNTNPPACNAIAAWQGRIVYSNAEDGQDWRFSQLPIAGQGLYFNETLQGGTTPQGAGPISGLAVMDDKLVIGTPTRKLAVSGQGPALNGLGGTYSDPQLLPSDVGFVDQRNIVLLPDVSAQDGAVGLQTQGGLAHQTEHGYYLLDRGLVDRYIGMPVEPLFLGGEAASSAVVLEDGHQLRITINDTVAVLDYLMGQWSTFTANPGAGVSFTSAVVWNRRWTAGGAMGASDGLALMLANTNEGLTSGLFQDMPELESDYGGFPVVMSLTTAWIRVSALQGFQRVTNAVFFGPWAAPSSFSVTIQYDYDSTNDEGPITANTGELVTGDRKRWQMTMQLPRQKCQALQFTITDTPSFGSMRGAGWSGVTLEVGVKRGTAKLPAGKAT